VFVSGLVGGGYYSCYYKPMSQIEEIHGTSSNANNEKTSIQDSSSTESIVKSGKITDRDYLSRLDRFNPAKLLESVPLLGSNQDIENDPSTDGYAEMPEYVSTMLSKKIQQPSTHTTARRIDNIHEKKPQAIEESLENFEVDLDKFLKKEQEKFAEKVKEMHPYGSDF